MKGFLVITLAIVMAFGVNSQVVIASSEDESMYIASDGTLVHNLSINPTEYDYSNMTVTAYTKDDYNYISDNNGDEYDPLQEPITRGDNPPSISHDLTVRDYSYNITSLAKYVYTNAYFNPSYMNEMSINIENLDSGGKAITVILYEVGSNKKISSWSGKPGNNEGEYVGVGFNGLDSNRNYYFKIEADVFTKVKGKGYIHHHYKN